MAFVRADEFQFGFLLLSSTIVFQFGFGSGRMFFKFPNIAKPCSLGAILGVHFKINWKHKMQDCNIIFEIWEEYKSSLLGYIQKRVRNNEDAKDILQDVLLKSYQFCSKGKTVLYLKSWLYKITQNTINDYYKKANKNIPFNTDPIYEENEPSLIGEASEYIKVLLKLLPDKYAIPLYMSDIEGIDQKTIAEELNLTLPNTKSRIQRGRIKLKERFLECCMVEFDEKGEMVSFEIKPNCIELQAEKKKLENIF
jgi:RNA polymerase sigma-70 factor, ECF subfamily